MDTDEPYVPEYELEPVTFQLPPKHSDDDTELVVIAKPQVTFVVLTVLPPPLEFMSTLYNNQVEISGRKLWCGGILLSQYILYTYYNTPFFHNQRILELGSGSGIVGMALALATISFAPSCLILTDGEDTSVELMHQNISQVNNQQLISTNSHCIYTTTMKWGDHRQDDFEHECRIQFPNVFPQGDDDEHVEFDCILAGDVLYKQELPSLFFQTVYSYLSKKKGGGYLLLCHVPRATVTHDLVLRVAGEYGFHKIETLDLSMIPIPESCPLEDAQRACIYKMSL